MSKWLKQQQLAAAKLMFNDVGEVPMSSLSPTQRDQLAEIEDSSIWGINPELLIELSESETLTLK